MGNWVQPFRFDADDQPFPPPSPLPLIRLTSRASPAIGPRSKSAGGRLRKQSRKRPFRSERDRADCGCQALNARELVSSNAISRCTAFDLVPGRVSSRPKIEAPGTISLIIGCELLRIGCERLRVTHIKQHLAHARVINYRNKSQYFIGLCLKFEILSREPP